MRGNRGRATRCWAVKTAGLLALVVLLGGVAAAEVRLEVRADGTLHLYNKPSRTLARDRYRPVVALSGSDLSNLIERHSARAELDPELVRAVIQAESGFDPTALSSKGAMGLMQLMPETAVRLAVNDPYDPDENIRGGTDYLRELLELFDGRLELALAGYNAGPEAVRQFNGIPPFLETRGYVERVLWLYRGENVSLPPLSARRGRKVYLVRRDQEGILLTTTPPPKR